MWEGTRNNLFFKVDEIWYEDLSQWDKTFYLYSIFKKNFATLIQGQIPVYTIYKYTNTKIYKYKNQVFFAFKHFLVGKNWKSFFHLICLNEPHLMVSSALLYHRKQRRHSHLKLLIACLLHDSYFIKKMAAKNEIVGKKAHKIWHIIHLISDF